MTSRPDPTLHAGRRALLAAALAVAAVIGSATPVGAQDGSTEPSVPELIVPGDTTATTAPGVPDEGELEPGTPAGTPDVVSEGSGDDGLAASTKVWIIIGGLVGVALLVLILTILYWRHTKPSAVAARAGEAPEPEEPRPAPEPAAPPGPDVVTTPEATVVPPEPAGGEAPPVGDEAPLDPRRSVFAPPTEPAEDRDV